MDVERLSLIISLTTVFVVVAVLIFSGTCHCLWLQVDSSEAWTQEGNNAKLFAREVIVLSTFQNTLRSGNVLTKSLRYPEYSGDCKPL